MATITPADVKKLREKTDAGMLDCKKALEEAGGDFAKAEKILKEKGLASASKRADRATSEGSIFVHNTEQKAVIMELSCETDFVSKTDQFKNLGQHLTQEILKNNLTTVTDDLMLPVKEAVAVLKENMSIKRFRTIDIGQNDIVSHYIHNGGQIGILVKATISGTDKNHARIKEFLFDCALHCAAMAPMYLDRSKVDPQYIKDQEEIFINKTAKDEKTAGKPEEIRKGIAAGMLNKHLAEVCLLEQSFVKDPSMTIAKKAEAISKEVGGTVVLSDFAYYRVGVE